MGLHESYRTQAYRDPNIKERSLTKDQQAMLDFVRTYPGCNGTWITKSLQWGRGKITKISVALMKRGLIYNQKKEGDGRIVFFFPDDPENPRGDTIGDRRGAWKEYEYQKRLIGEQMRKATQQRMRVAYCMLLERRKPTIAEIARELQVTDAAAVGIVEKLCVIGLARIIPGANKFQRRKYEGILPDIIPLTKGRAGRPAKLGVERLRLVPRSRM
jgi:DNA-binding MarR family transcriptional regulator